MKWEASEHTAAVLYGAASRICSKRSILCSLYLAFSSSVLLDSWSCNHILVLIRLQLRRIPALFYRRDQISVLSITYQKQSTPFHAWGDLLSVDEMLLLRYLNGSTNFRCFPFNVKITPSCLKHMNSGVFLFTLRAMSLASCYILCSRNLTWVHVFAVSARPHIYIYIYIYI